MGMIVADKLLDDAARLDWLERRANERGGLLLHDGSEQGRTGLGLRPGFLNRTLREAIDTAMAGEARSNSSDGAKEAG